jgi:hypothetical protein
VRAAAGVSQWSGRGAARRLKRVGSGGGGGRGRLILARASSAA